MRQIGSFYGLAHALTVDIKTFQGNDAVFENIKATTIQVANLEAETARI